MRIELKNSKSKAVIEDSDEDVDDATPAAGSPARAGHDDATNGQAEGEGLPAGSPAEGGPDQQDKDEDSDA